ncbi:hypothetical protein EVAR_35375_1 [Eumeta japonica]|uniref:Uncharacterized protein n=1 Tax=Eumeta variegata TaxID=151549 RepID=A0A4C2A2X1_EUMVA|nr:hypothetical protein EVAR_35375_1 [Eumeta japonica]
MCATSHAPYRNTFVCCAVSRRPPTALAQSVANASRTERCVTFATRKYVPNHIKCMKPICSWRTTRHDTFNWGAVLDAVSVHDHHKFGHFHRERNPTDAKLSPYFGKVQNLSRKLFSLPLMCGVASTDAVSKCRDVCKYYVKPNVGRKHDTKSITESCIIALWRRHPRTADRKPRASGNNSVDREFRFDNEMTQL